MNLKRFVAVVVVFASLASIAGATCVVRHRNAVVVQQAAVVAPVVTPVVAVPQYGATYDDGAAKDNQIKDLTKRLADAEARIAVLESARDNLTTRLAAVESKAGVTPPAPAAPAPAAAPKKEEGNAKQEAKVRDQIRLPVLVARSCVKCHNPQKASGGLELVDARGNLTKLASDLRLEVLKRINLPADNPKVMPPQGSKVPEDVKKPATDEEAAEMMDVMTQK